jgi:hypothetical protein
VKHGRNVQPYVMGMQTHLVHSAARVRCHNLRVP